jgi:hypothetical protein
MAKRDWGANPPPQGLDNLSADELRDYRWWLREQRAASDEGRREDAVELLLRARLCEDEATTLRARAAELLGRP